MSQGNGLRGRILCDITSNGSAAVHSNKNFSFLLLNSCIASSKIKSCAKELDHDLVGRKQPATNLGSLKRHATFRLSASTILCRLVL